MGVMNVGKRDGVTVSDSGQMFARFFTEVTLEAKRLQQALNADPMKLEEIEREVLELFGHGAGLFLTGLIAERFCWHEVPCTWGSYRRLFNAKEYTETVSFSIKIVIQWST